MTPDDPHKQLADIDLDEYVEIFSIWLIQRSSLFAALLFDSSGLKWVKPDITRVRDRFIDIEDVSQIEIKWFLRRNAGIENHT